MYNHTQKGYLLINISIALSIYFFFISKKAEDLKVSLLMLSIVLLVLSFSTLNVRIDHKELKIKFGFGIYRKRFLLKDIKSTSIVKNRWFYGWGIRYWAPKRMWVFNVSGFDAVELNMKDGRTYRIGTDDPKNLKRHLNHRAGSA